jgi:hypothetical protein
VPPAQAPVAGYVRNVVALRHAAAGGELQVVSWKLYEHEPPLQAPGLPYTRRVVVFAQVVAGGVVQLTPAQGSGLQVPPAQPKEHVVSVGV